MVKEDHIKPEQELANAIIMKVVKDYESALRKKKKAIQIGMQVPPIVEGEINSCERFFKGEWIKMLTKVDGKIIMKECKERVRRGEK